MSIFRSVLLILFVLATTNTYAQKFYLAPFVGAGMTKVNVTTENIGGLTQGQYDPAISFSGGVNAGLAIKLLRIETGVQLLTTGSRYDESFTTSTGSDSFDVNIRYRYLQVPINIGLAIKAGSRLSIVPMVGVSPSLNIGLSMKRESYINGTTDKANFSASETFYRVFVLWSNAKVNFEYKLNKKIAVFLTPAFYRMLSSPVEEFDYTNVFAQPVSYKERHHAFTGNAGILIRL